MYIKKSVLVICAVILIIATALGTVMTINPFGAFNFKDFFKFRIALDILDKFYYENIDTQKLVDGALLGASLSLEDPYTVYMSEDEAESFVENVESDDYTGVGLYITEEGNGNGVTIVSPLKDSPAEKAGIVSGDKILSVNGQSVAGVNIDTVAADMKGPEGTDVTLSVLKKSTGETVDITLTRAKIRRETVISQMLDDEVAYIQISQFGVNTFSEFAQQFNGLVGQGMKRLVLDLRNNPGGLMETAVNIADSFISDGEIVYTLDKNDRRRDYMATPDKTTLPMVVLTNGGSASASEVLVGALHAHGLVTIIGEKTFGKGVTQIPYKFRDGSIMKITDSRYYTPNDVCIDHQGIMPDIEVTMTDEEYAAISGVDVQHDLQLQKAIEVVKQK
jgi:carboxyl-terminal processing protease